jgi:TM2 domain-containing membrane protein YozV
MFQCKSCGFSGFTAQHLGRRVKCKCGKPVVVHAWYVIEKTTFKESNVGPISEPQLKQMASEGRVNRETKISSQSRTKGKWIDAGSIGAIEKIIASKEAAAVALKKEKTRVKTEKKQKRAQKKANLQNAKQQRRQQQDLANSTFATITTDNRAFCPFCKNEVNFGALKCQTCHSILNRELHLQSMPDKWSRGIAILLSLLIPGAGHLYKGDIFSGLLFFILIPIGYLLFIIPGAILHFISIVTAGLGNTKA